MDIILNRPYLKVITRCVFFKKKFSDLSLPLQLSTMNRKHWKLQTIHLYGLGAGVWSRDMNTAYRFGRRKYKLVECGTNCYHAYPAHAAFGGYKRSGIGRETHLMMLNRLSTNKKFTGKLQ